MINKMLFAISGHMPMKFIRLDGANYIERYFVGERNGAVVYLHRYTGGDSERHVHNHPWRWGFSFILRGGYTEQRMIDVCPDADESGCLTKTVNVKWFNWIGGNTFHRIIKTKPGTWSLVIHGPRPNITTNPGGRIIKKGWGFFSRASLDSGAVTVFKNYPGASKLRWWVSAKTGNELDREPL